MLRLKKMEWGNCFSYGPNNRIIFDENPLTQLIGANGAGKTSISLMLQEVLYGKNIKNIKKQDIVNNKSGKPGYYIHLQFYKDGHEYTVYLDRKSSLKLQLYKDDKNISSHTSLGTYKTISDIIGIPDFKVFCQLIYQHSTDSLEFLTATDTNRKKFLISLLQLDRYLELHEHFKVKIRELNNEVGKLIGSVGTIELWIDKHKDMDFTKKDLLTVPEIPENLYTDKKELDSQITNINSINRKIVANKEHKDKLDKLNENYYLGNPPAKPEHSSNELKSRLRVLESKKTDSQQKINKLLRAQGECPTCLQEVDEDKKSDMIAAEELHRDNLEKDIADIRFKIHDAENIEKEIQRYEFEKSEFSRLMGVIDTNLPFKTLDLYDLQKQRAELSSKIVKLENDRKATIEENNKISAHNSKIDVVKSQLKEMNEDLHNKNVQLIEKENLLNVLELLKKTFSTNGLVSYKIESSIKELENKINEYLAELTYFQLYFKLDGEKLNIEVLDDVGNITSISNLSSGERARVNLATLLGIRNILSSLTSTKINLLFLDEITGSLDAEGKEKFTEILLKENLNTFFVAHEWTHPLVPSIEIVKEHNISRISDGR